MYHFINKLLLILFAIALTTKTAYAEKVTIDDLADNPEHREIVNMINNSLVPAGPWPVRIDFDPVNKSVWVVDANGALTFIDQTAKTMLGVPHAGLAADVGVGGGYVFFIRRDGSIWRASTETPIYGQYLNSQLFLSSVDKSPRLKRIDVNDDGSIWGVGLHDNYVYHWDGLSWSYLGQDAANISIDLDTGRNSVYMTKTDGTSWILDKLNREWKLNNWTRRSIAIRVIEK